MPRQARKESGTGIYHVMLRGINRQDLFEDREDYGRMLGYLQQMLEQYDEQGNHKRSGDGSLIRSVIRDKSYLIHTCHDKRSRSGDGSLICFAQR